MGTGTCSDALIGYAKNQMRGGADAVRGRPSGPYPSMRESEGVTGWTTVTWRARGG
jgi:hypothetical protein